MILSGASCSLEGRVELSDNGHALLLEGLKTPADYVEAGKYCTYDYLSLVLI